MKKAIVLSLLFWCFFPLFSQVLSKREFIKAVKEADLVYYREKKYEKAASMYETLLKAYPGNANLTAKLGICYLNIDGKKTDALELLKKASANMVSNDAEYVEYGEKAASDTYLYCAIAYHQNDSLRKALSMYLDIKKKLAGSDDAKDQYLDNQIGDCRYALELLKKPLKIDWELFAPWLIDYPGACNPVLSKNDSVFVFTENNAGKTRILCSYKSDKWENPKDITNSLGGFDRFYTNSITGNGKLLVLFMDDGDDGNLYYSERVDTTWSKIKSMGRYINTVYWESDGFITPDGKTFFLASNRPGGEGGLDIWVSEKIADGTWGRPVNCGDVINTPYNDNTPFYDPDTKALLFSSMGHRGMGGYDIYRSVNMNGVWTIPVCMPYAFNTTTDNTFFILNNNKPGFITSLYNEKNKTRNIYSIVAENPSDKITRGVGTISLKDGSIVDPKKAKIQISDIKKGAEVKNIAMSDSGSFRFEIKPGDYRLLVGYTGYKTDTTNINLPLFFSESYISIKTVLSPENVFRGNFLAIKNILFELDSYILNEEAMENLKIIKDILVKNPELEVEIAGYTDAIGSTEYNYKLADERAESAINYLVVSGIERARMTKKAYGKTNYVARNVNPNGSDNPEGRKYNRRVVFGILDPQTGVLVNQETYTPEHLRQPSSMAYSIVLIKSTKDIESSYFSSLKLNEIQSIRPIKSDSVTLYVLGVFYSKNDAKKYLDFAVANGFKDAYIVNNYEITYSSKPIVEEAKPVPLASETTFTIQVMAKKEKVDMDIFKGIDGVREISSKDGLYRYISGKYSSYLKAKDDLVTIQDKGFKDAFIRELNLPVYK